MNRKFSVLLALLIPTLILFYLSLAPYTKVEESFNVQATHDILTNGLPFRNVRTYLHENYDHLTFTGPIPRTFVGPLALASAAFPFKGLVKGVDRQILVRAILGLYNAFSLLYYRNGVVKIFGRGPANWFLLFTSCQFHVLFWASRTLPNFFALGLCTTSLRLLLPPPTPRSPTITTSIRREQLSLTILTILGIVFRSELAVLLGFHTLALVFTRRLFFSEVLAAGFTGIITGLLLTVPLDTLMWASPTPLWPELAGFVYNILQGEASEWGVSPWYYYFASALPKLLLNPATYACLGFTCVHPVLRGQTVQMIAPSLAFVAVYSLVPHKEWRFIVYVLPPLTAAAARGADWIWVRGDRSVVYKFLRLALATSILASWAAGLAMGAISSLNYPGAEALNRLHARADGSVSTINVHMDALSCMTGVTRFLQVPDMPQVSTDVETEAQRTRWIYDKTDNQTTLLQPDFWEKFDYVLTDDVGRVPGSWEIVDVVKGYAGIESRRPDDGGGSGKEHTPDASSSSTQLKPWLYGEGPWAGLERRIVGVLRRLSGTKHGKRDGLLDEVKSVARKFTGGWWIGPRMEEQIWILKRGRNIGDAA